MNEIPLIIDGLSSCTKANKIEVLNNFSWKQCVYLKNHFPEVLIGLELFASQLKLTTLFYLTAYAEWYANAHK